MIVLIAGASHTGKTNLAQKLLERYKYPYLSIDHLKMGLIRSGNTELTVYDDDKLTPYLWNIIKEIVKTAIENNQNLVVEGCYIPFDWKESFNDYYLKHIRYCCLVMTEDYIKNHFDSIKGFADIIENRGDDSDCTEEMLLADNAFNLEMCRKYGCNYILIDDNYEAEINISKTEMIEFREITLDELNMDLFSDFIRRQAVTKVWRKEQGKWVIKDDPFIDDWSPEDYAFGISCIQNTVKTGGLLWGAFSDGRLKGFVSVEAEIFGGEHKYMDLTSIHVSEDMRSKGIGRQLFQKAKEWAAAQGAKKLYISSHSAVESQAFYKSMGCTEAQLYNKAHTEKEPFDVQLECRLI